MRKLVCWIVKIMFLIFIMFTILQSILIDGVHPYCSYKDYEYQNNFNEDCAKSLENYAEVSQLFTAKGNVLDNVSLYLSDSNGEILNVGVYTESGELITETSVDTIQYENNSWNKIGLTTDKIIRGKNYKIIISCQDHLNTILYSTDEASVIYGICTADHDNLNGTLAVGLQFTYCYLTLGSTFELALKIFISLLLGGTLCFCVIKIEYIYKIFKLSEKKKGFIYALYFSVSLSLLYDPLKCKRNEITEFNRVFGAGLIENVDVSKRINNFNYWFVFFAVSFILFYFLANYCLHMKKSGECKKIERFLDHFMILANCNLLLECITYFNVEFESSITYYFSAHAITMIIIVAICYILLNLDENISADEYAKLHFAGIVISIPITILIALEWDSGKVLLGTGILTAIIIIVFCKYGKRIHSYKHFKNICTVGALYLPCIPVITSLYIEMIHVLNQHKVFVEHPDKCYKTIIVLVAFAFFCISILFIKKKIVIRKWKAWAYPWFVLGISLLSIQIPISSVYTPDLCESSNYGILISDFLNYGTIPIVEHYGGHMMTSVWEGILYGLVNNDYSGAVVSPYSSLIIPVLVVLFYYFVKQIWNEDMALLTSLLFPFIGFWSYYGLGMIICLAFQAYVKKQTYVRTAILCLAFIWCTAYRLDLGFSFGLAFIISFIIYVSATKNWKEIKKLGITLSGGVLQEVWHGVSFV